MALIALQGVAKRYGSGDSVVEALKPSDLTIEEGEILALMGPSGSGKSTLLSILGAMNPPSEGTLLVDDIDVYSLSSEKRADFRREYLGFVFQQLQLIPYLTALENVLLPLAISRHSHKEQKAMAVKALERVGLGDKLKRLPNQLSGGEQERVAIARAIVNGPPLILADEPTGSLDSRTGEEVMEVFQSLNGDGMTIVIVTHNAENTRYVERTVHIRDGRIIGDESGDQRQMVEAVAAVPESNGHHPQPASSHDQKATAKITTATVRGKKAAG